MNETTKELLDKLEEIVEEYNTEDVEPNILLKEFTEMVNNRC